METKNEKFIRMRDVRLPKAVKAVSLLGNLASRDYEYSKDEGAALVAELDEVVEEVAKKFGVLIEEDAELEAHTHEPLTYVGGTVTGRFENPAADGPPYGGTEWDLVSHALEALGNQDPLKAAELLRKALSS